MDRFRGILQIRLCNPQSRSEGRFAFLVMGDEELELCREGGLPMNDPYYEPFDAKYVEIEGTLSHGALIVESIEERQEPVKEERAAQTEEAEEAEGAENAEESAEQQPTDESPAREESEQPEDK